MFLLWILPRSVPSSAKIGFSLEPILRASPWTHVPPFLNPFPCVIITTSRYPTPLQQDTPPTLFQTTRFNKKTYIWTNKHPPTNKKQNNKFHTHPQKTPPKSQQCNSSPISTTSPFRFSTTVLSRGGTSTSPFDRCRFQLRPPATCSWAKEVKDQTLPLERISTRSGFSPKAVVVVGWVLRSWGIPVGRSGFGDSGGGFGGFGCFFSLLFFFFLFGGEER